LLQWQKLNFELSRDAKAMRCVVCEALFTYPSYLAFLGARYYYAWQRQRDTLHFVFSLALYMLHMLGYFFLVLVTVPSGTSSYQIFGNKCIAWLDLVPEPKLAIIYASDRQVPLLQKGSILVATQNMPADCMFHQKMILVLEHAPQQRSKGVIINFDVDEGEGTRNIGGPVEQEETVLLHTCKRISSISSCVISAEEQAPTESAAAATDATLLYYSEDANALLALQELSNDAAAASQVVLLHGKCSWLASQLEGEIKAGFWTVLPPCASRTNLIFRHN